MNLKTGRTKVRERLGETRKLIADNFRGAMESVTIGKNVERQVANLQKGIENSVKLILELLDVPTRKEINELEKKLDVLASKMEKLSERLKEKPAAKKTTKKTAPKKTAKKTAGVKKKK